MSQQTENQPNPVTFTPAEKHEVLNALYFFEATLTLDLTGQELTTIQAAITKLEENPETS